MFFYSLLKIHDLIIQLLHFTNKLVALFTILFFLDHLHSLCPCSNNAILLHLLL